MSRTTVILADDHQLFLDGLVTLLGEDFEVLEVVREGRALVAAARRLRPDIIVCDFAMPGLNGIEAFRRIRAEGVPSALVLLTMHKEVEYAVQAIEAGASGFLLKHAAAAELRTALDEILKGQVYVTPLMSKAVMDALARRRQPPRPGEAALTARQSDILRMVSRGLAAKEIGSRLGISPRTVEYHKYRLMRELGLSSSAELIRYALEQGLGD